MTSGKGSPTTAFQMQSTFFAVATRTAVSIHTSDENDETQRDKNDTIERR